MKMTAAITVLAALAIAGCGSDDAESTTVPASGPLLNYEKSGGVAGVLEGLEIDRDGTAIVRVGYSDPVERTFVIGPQELSQIEDELDAVDFDAFDPSDPTACADCFVYALRAGGRELEYAEVDQPPEPLQSLISHLGSIVSNHYPESAPSAP